jgi:hypothetical protein
MFISIQAKKQAKKSHATAPLRVGGRPCYASGSTIELLVGHASAAELSYAATGGRGVLVLVLKRLQRTTSPVK